MVTDVKKTVVKAKILTGTYILIKKRQSFSSGTVDAVCHHTLHHIEFINRAQAQVSLYDFSPSEVYKSHILNRMIQ